MKNMLIIIMLASPIFLYVRTVALSGRVKAQSAEINELKAKSDSLSVLAAKKTKDRHNQQLREAFRNGWYNGGNAAIQACTKAAATGTKIKEISIEADSLKFEQLFIDKGAP